MFFVAYYYYYYFLCVCGLFVCLCLCFFIFFIFYFFYFKEKRVKWITSTGYGFISLSDKCFLFVDTLHHGAPVTWSRKLFN